MNNAHETALKIATIVQDHGQAGVRDIADALQVKVTSLSVYVTRARKLGYLEYVKPGEYPARYRLTAEGVALLEAEDSRRINHVGEGLVQRAMRTQPASIWALGNS